MRNPDARVPHTTVAGLCLISLDLNQLNARTRIGLAHQCQQEELYIEAN